MKSSTQEEAGMARYDLRARGEDAGGGAGPGGRAVSPSCSAPHPRRHGAAGGQLCGVEESGSGAGSTDRARPGHSLLGELGGILYLLG